MQEADQYNARGRPIPGRRLSNTRQEAGQHQVRGIQIPGRRQATRQEGEVAGPRQAGGGPPSLKRRATAPLPSFCMFR
jgi:hypothetical protein